MDYSKFENTRELHATDGNEFYSKEFGYKDWLELRVSENDFAMWEHVIREPNL